MDRFEPSAETAALHAVMIEEPQEAERILGDFLNNELRDLYRWVSQLQDKITQELRSRGTRDV